MATTDTWISDLAARRLSIEHEAGVQASMLVSEMLRAMLNGSRRRWI